MAAKAKKGAAKKGVVKKVTKPAAKKKFKGVGCCAGGGMAIR